MYNSMRPSNSIVIELARDLVSIVFSFAHLAFVFSSSSLALFYRVSLPLSPPPSTISINLLRLFLYKFDARFSQKTHIDTVARKNHKLPFKERVRTRAQNTKHQKDHRIDIYVFKAYVVQSRKAHKGIRKRARRFYLLSIHRPKATCMP